MSNSGFLSVSEFAKFSRTTTHTLRHYDKLGLLSPISRGANKYRYYNTDQIAVVNLIRTLQELGMALDEIQDFKNHRSPEVIDELFTNQVKKIDTKIEEWMRARKLLFTLQKSIRSGLSINENEITIQYVPAQAIVLGGQSDYSHGKNDYDALFSFYRTMLKKHPNFDMNHSVWGVFSEARIKRGDLVWPDRYYFYDSAGQDQRPAALYAIGYSRNGYGKGQELYKRLIEYIDKHGFEICGDAYEEYPLNEICIADKNNYLMRVMITVRAKG